MSAFAAERQFGRPAMPLHDRQIVSAYDYHPTVRADAQRFAVPGDTVRSVLAPGGEATFPSRTMSHSVARPATSATRSLPTPVSCRLMRARETIDY